jgi:hypothetical protein
MAMLAGACGYHTGGHADLLPKTIKTIAVPAFTNGNTTAYKLTDRLPEAVARELIARTKYRVVSDQKIADAVLRGSITSYSSFPTVFDSATARAAAVEVHVTMQISLVERATGKVLFTRPRVEAVERFQVAAVASQYFEEDQTALERISKASAARVVSDILNDF